jgi:ABC-type branched-subunit amino acid transport system substrate-binding protein
MIAYLSQHSSNKNMKIISPLSNDTKLDSNSNIFQVRASKQTHLQQLLNFIVDNHADENIILVHDDSKSSHSILDIIKKFANDTSEHNQIMDFHYTEVIFKDFFKEDNLDEEEVEITSIKNIIDTLSQEKKNVIFPLIMQKNYAVDFINKLNLMDDSLKENVILFGLPTWKNIESLDYEKMENLETHISTTSFIDYDEEKVKRFVREYRAQYKTEPELYAFLGYDITLYFLKALHKYGLDFEKCLENINNDMLSMKFNFTGEGPQHGFENTHIFIFKYKNYKKVDVKEQMRMEKVLDKKPLRKEKEIQEME